MSLMQLVPSPFLHAGDSVLQGQDLLTVLPELYSEMEVRVGAPKGIHKDPEFFVKNWLQPYTQHFSYMLSVLSDSHALPSYSHNYSTYGDDRLVNRLIEEQLYCMMCLPTSLWRPVALMAMQQFRVCLDNGEATLRSGKIGETLLAFLQELECLAVYMENSSLIASKKQQVYAQASIKS